MQLKRCVVLASGRGSNFDALIRGAQHYLIEALISDKEDAYALKIAQHNNIPIHVISSSLYKGEAFTQKLLETLVTLDPDFILLAGFMKIVKPAIVNRFRRRIINIHPSLLPKFPGLDTHTRALEAKEKLHGCTVHYVDEGVDTGEIIEQASVPVLENDTSETLQQRVLKEEHSLFPRVVNRLCKG